MGRPCGPCSDPRRNEIDERLLKKDFTGESFRRISADFGYSETALRRHLNEHLTVDLAAVQAGVEQARKDVLAEAEAKEREAVADAVKNTAAEKISARLEAAANYLDQLRILRERAAITLENAEGAEDLKTILQAIKELREMVRLMAELEGKLQAQQQINIISSPEWIELRTLILYALDPFPEAKVAVVNAIHK
ncbi:MAG: hypothetical protein HPY61_09330 [Methanotrichaceae archaeon]|nr:hypothetical protein [Methanotrichaceae archaeon]